MVNITRPRLALAALALLSVGAWAGNSDAVAGSWKMASWEKLQTQLYARGVQIYRCAANDDNQTGKWVFQAPEADLFSDLAMTDLVAKHFDGPQWQALDGSQVSGKVRATKAAPDANDIPWLILSGSSHQLPGIFAHISTIQRVDTHGGTTGKAICAKAQYGATLKVPYTATYRFFTS
jgi:hypothetical protein